MIQIVMIKLDSDLMIISIKWWFGQLMSKFSKLIYTKTGQLLSKIDWLNQKSILFDHMQSYMTNWDIIQPFGILFNYFCHLKWQL